MRSRIPCLLANFPYFARRESLGKALNLARNPRRLGYLQARALRDFAVFSRKTGNERAETFADDCFLHQFPGSQLLAVAANCKRAANLSEPMSEVAAG
jgi:hypothetical protein